MQDDPTRYWQDLTDNYRGMSDGELLELAEKPEDLTDVAQQVLRDEMKLRRLDKARPSPATHGSGRVGVFRDEYIPSGSEELGDDGDERETAPEYTWKTPLCDCESNDQAWQLREALKRHGIESWVRAVPASSTDVAGPQIYVAADQLEQAQAVAAQPIPQDIIDDWNEVVPEFEVPVCPGCGSMEGVVLENTSPVNSWFCESCEAEWSDPEPGADEKADARKPSTR
ncbi:MAG TPA: hypothetical protein VGL00_00040 [Terracidiphilus sp.]